MLNAFRVAFRKAHRQISRRDVVRYFPIEIGSAVCSRKLCTVFSEKHAYFVGAVRDRRLFSSGDRHIVLMKGLNFEAKEQDVIDFFKPLGITPSKVRLRCDIAGRVSGLCEVEFATHAEAVIAMRKKNAFIGSRFIRLMHKPTQEEQSGASDTFSASRESPGDVKPKEKKNVQIENLDRSSFATGHFVRIKNLHPRTTEHAVYHIFSPLNIRPVSIKPVYDENGCRTGMFDVEFLSHDDAVIAMKKDKEQVGQRCIELVLKSDTKPVPRADLSYA